MGGARAPPAPPTPTAMVTGQDDFLLNSLNCQDKEPTFPPTSGEKMNPGNDHENANIPSTTETRLEKVQSRKGARKIKTEYHTRKSTKEST